MGLVLERIVLSSCGTGLIAGGSTDALFLLVYGIILLVFGVQYSITKKSILKKLNNPDISIKTNKIKIKFDLLFSYNY